jgi:hypothetical protein
MTLVPNPGNPSGMNPIVRPDANSSGGSGDEKDTESTTTVGDEHETAISESNTSPVRCFITI